jgi:hypothetical protein
MQISAIAASDPKLAPINVTTAGNSVLVDAVPLKKIRVVQLLITVKRGVDINFQGSGDASKKTGPGFYPPGGGAALPFSPIGWFETAAGEALEINLSLESQVGGMLSYVEI